LLRDSKISLRNAEKTRIKNLSRVLYFPSIDRFPSFILIASPTVIGTTLTLHPQQTDSAGNLKVPLEIKNFS